MSANEWKIKYYELKNKWMDSVDKAYRMGYEIGGKEATMEAQAQQMQQMQEQQMQQQQMQEAGMGGEMPVDENGQPMDPEMAAQMEGEEGFAPPPEEIDPEKSAELDAHIQELEGMVAKGEKPSVKDLRKAIENISDIRKGQKDKWTKKVEKKTTAQKKFVDGILAKWSDDEKDLTKVLEDNIKSQGLKLED